MRRPAWSTLAPTRPSDSPWRRRWRVGDLYLRGRAEVRSKSSGMRECWRLLWTRVTLRLSWSACSPILDAAPPSVRPRGGVRSSGIRSNGWSGSTPSWWNPSDEKQGALAVANRAPDLEPVLAGSEQRVRRAGARPRRPRAHHDGARGLRAARG